LIDNNFSILQVIAKNLQPEGKFRVDDAKQKPQVSLRLSSFPV